MATHRHLTTTTQLTRDWIESELFTLCDDLRNGCNLESKLAGRSVYCLFYEPSFLTRTSFERVIPRWLPPAANPGPGTDLLTSG